MQANQRVSAPGRGLLAASTASRARNARFTVAEDAGRGDPRFKTSGIRGMSVYKGGNMSEHDELIDYRRAKPGA
jgi:hypothetical protein